MYKIAFSLIITLALFSNITYSADGTEKYNKFISGLTGNCCQTDPTPEMLVGTYFDLETLKEYFKTGKIPRGRSILNGQGYSAYKQNKALDSFLSLDDKQVALIYTGNTKEINRVCESISDAKKQRECLYNMRDAMMGYFIYKNMQDEINKSCRRHVCPSVWEEYSNRSVLGENNSSYFDYGQDYYGTTQINEKSDPTLYHDDTKGSPNSVTSE